LRLILGLFAFLAESEDAFLAQSEDAFLIQREDTV
jgi:hypothetical protein